MTDTILDLHHGALRLALRPDLGGSIAGLWHGTTPVLRSTDASALAGPRASGCFALVPYSNRIGEGRFRWHGEAHATVPNFDGEPHSLHGVGWRRPWQVASHDGRSAVLTLAHAGDADWPFAFDAEQTVALDDRGLELRLTVTNRAAVPAPLGLGWHPYFPRRARSRLHVELSHRWDRGGTGLPTERHAQHGIDADVTHLQYDHCFEGWRGPARLRDEALSLTLTSSLPYVVVFTPPDKPFYCVEPVSHVNNAINMPDPAAHGLAAVAPGASVGGWMRLDVADVHSPRG